ncbi:glycosyltransferase family 9 protein [Shewanella yunxiaonensis]|uniref:Glycosyltransferase family 9 protein n=1 Tax=Shewanella yunxiaonensis TaxID=2829809 RepID=A0ABX7YT85_9GAMM|nr:glycosyltransferase family 9 protein [Shewanella yunxiaonensis]QUN05864.1 glycosyltransferase family 9 protein [Shewanella yunxiaonensis]
MAVIDKALLLKAQKLLVMSPFALGDFLYIKTFLEAVKQQYPHLQIDIWLDDDRNDKQVWRLARSHIMQQWIEAEPAFGNMWGCCDSPVQQQRQIAQAAQQGYDIIVTLPQSRGKRYLSIARKIAPAALLVAGPCQSFLAKRLGFWFYRKANARFAPDIRLLPQDHHITDRYYQWAHGIFGIELAGSALLPSLRPDKPYLTAAQQWIAQHFPNQSGPLVFLNHLSTDHRRDWSIGQLFALIDTVNQRRQSRFILNVTGEKQQEIQQAVSQLPTALQSQIAVFTVSGHFFELPAMIACSDLAISVETSIMHFAGALKVPLIALMRQRKPYWAPPKSALSTVIYAADNGYVSDIAVQQVMDVITQRKLLLDCCNRQQRPIQ